MKELVTEQHGALRVLFIFDPRRTAILLIGGEERLQEAVEQAAAEHDEGAKRLAEIRRARRLTQDQLARSLDVSQAQVSRIENQTDLYLSTLASYIEAMGGELQLVGVFKDTGVTVHIAINDELKPRPSTARLDLNRPCQARLAGALCGELLQVCTPGAATGSPRRSASSRRGVS
jgi:transcriptional regulator with XRE-family HTH domain